jgi:hypothetical protein
MRIFCRVLPLFLVSVFAVSACAQVLARPGWAGSGVTAEPWWQRAVFYRVDPLLFQDSDGDSKGDVQGIVQRLSYIQQLGVDAILLKTPTAGTDLGDLVRLAGQSHVRVLVEMQQASVNEARMWLNQGVAGLYVDPLLLTGDGAARMRELRHTLDSFPGQRVLIGPGLTGRGNESPELTLAADINGTHPDAGILRRQMATVSEGSGTPGINPVLELRGLPMGQDDAAKDAILNRTLAAVLFGSRAAVIFDAGRELGMRSADGREAVMQWTPTNVKQEPKPEPVVEKPKPTDEVYGAFTPYIPPPKLKLGPPPMPQVVESSSPPPVDPNSQPGFTTEALTGSAALNGATTNAATETIDTGSLLNFYRHLIAMHHGNGSLHNGQQYVFDHDASNALVWVRRAPAGARTVGTVFLICNLSDHPVELDLRNDLAKLHLRNGTLRPLLTASTSAETAALSNEQAQHVLLPASTVFIGELSR